MQKIRTVVTLRNLQQRDADDKWVEVEDGDILEDENRRDAEEPKRYEGTDIVATGALFPGLTLVTQDLFSTETL
jgi:hypothetical protein